MKSLFIVILTITFALCLAQKPKIEWADIPAGTFTMGSPANEVDRRDDERLHQVKLGAFKMSKTEITVAQFKAFIDATSYVTDADKGPYYSGSSIIISGTNVVSKAGVNWKCDHKGNPRSDPEYNHPVLHVSWNDAFAFAEWMDCRLPTEAEWEYACRAGTNTPFNTGDNLTTAQANYDGNFPYNNQAEGEYREKTLPVGSFEPNAFGLYDMHGNVWEWCSDWYGDYSKEDQTDPKGPEGGSMRVVRGGGWYSDAQGCRSANRSYFSPYFPLNFGFRVVSPQ